MSMIQVGPAEWMDPQRAARLGRREYTPPASSKTPVRAAPGPKGAAAPPRAAAPPPARAVTAKDVPTTVRMEIEAGERKRASAQLVERLFEVARDHNVPHEFVDRLVRNL